MENRIISYVFLSYILIALVAAMVAMTHSTEVKIQRKILTTINDNGCSNSEIKIKEKLIRYIDEYAIENL